MGTATNKAPRLIRRQAGSNSLRGVPFWSRAAGAPSSGDLIFSASPPAGGLTKPTANPRMHHATFDEIGCKTSLSLVVDFNLQNDRLLLRQALWRHGSRPAVGKTWCRQQGSNP